MKIDAEKSKIYSFSDPMKDLYMCGALFAGERGYFSDNPNFADCIEGVLGDMNIHAKHDEGNYFPFRMEDEGVLFKFFCPRAYAIETPELRSPELRSYKTLDELPFRVGDSVTFRKKGAKEQMILICSGIIVNGPQLAFIHLGACVYGPESLFEGYEYFNGKEWVPFGVEE